MDDYLQYVYDCLKERTAGSRTVDHRMTSRLSDSGGMKFYHDCIGLPYRRAESLMSSAGGGLCCGGRIIDNTSLVRGTQGVYDFDADSADMVSGPVIFVGTLCNWCWGDLITNSLAHVWWFHTKDYKERFAGCPVYYLSPEPLSGNFLDLLELAGLPAHSLVYLERPTFFGSAVVPDSCFDRTDANVRIYTDEYVDLIDHIIDECAGPAVGIYPKICLIRPNQSRQYFCKDIWKTLKKRGYVMIDPCRYSVREQIRIYRNAEEIVAEESTLSHNAVFCNPGTKIYLLRKIDGINEYQAAINQMRNLDVTYVDCHLSVLNEKTYKNGGPFFCYANELFCQCFNVKYKGFPYREFRKWLNYHNWFDEDIHAHADRLRWDVNCSEIFARELSYSRISVEKRLEWVRHMPFIPHSIRDRGFSWLVKRYMRGLM